MMDSRLRSNRLLPRLVVSPAITLMTSFSSVSFLLSLCIIAILSVVPVSAVSERLGHNTSTIQIVTSAGYLGLQDAIDLNLLSVSVDTNCGKNACVRGFDNSQISCESVNPYISGGDCSMYACAWGDKGATYYCWQCSKLWGADVPGKTEYKTGTIADPVETIINGMGCPAYTVAMPLWKLSRTAIWACKVPEESVINLREKGFTAHVATQAELDLHNNAVINNNFSLDLGNRLQQDGGANFGGMYAVRSTVASMYNTLSPMLSTYATNPFTGATSCPTNYSATFLQRLYEINRAVSGSFYNLGWTTSSRGLNINSQSWIDLYVCSGDLQNSTRVADFGGLFGGLYYWNPAWSGWSPGYNSLTPLQLNTTPIVLNPAYGSQEFSTGVNPFANDAADCPGDSTMHTIYIPGYTLFNHYFNGNQWVEVYDGYGYQSPTYNMNVALVYAYCARNASTAPTTFGGMFLESPTNIFGVRSVKNNATQDVSCPVSFETSFMFYDTYAKYSPFATAGGISSFITDMNTQNSVLCSGAYSPCSFDNFNYNNYYYNRYTNIAYPEWYQCIQRN